MKNLFLGFGLLLISVVLFDSCGEDSNPTNSVKNDTTLYVTIGSQVWLKKNLDVVTYSNGDTINECNDSLGWYNAYNEHVGVWRWNFDSTCRLYNGWVVLDPRGIAPIGYRLPDTSDIILLAKNYNVKFRQSDTITNIYSTRLGDFLCYKLEDDGFYNKNLEKGYWNYDHYGYNKSDIIFWVNSESSPSSPPLDFKTWLGHKRIYTFEKGDYSLLYPKILINAYPIRCLKN